MGLTCILLQKSHVAAKQRLERFSASLASGSGKLTKAALQSRHLDRLALCSSLCVCHREVLGRSVVLSKAIEALTHSTEGCH